MSYKSGEYQTFEIVGIFPLENFREFFDRFMTEFISWVVEVS